MKMDKRSQDHLLTLGINGPNCTNSTCEITIHAAFMYFSRTQARIDVMIKHVLIYGGNCYTICIDGC